MRFVAALLIVTSLSCSDAEVIPDAQPDAPADAPSAQTWGDAVLVWSSSWCSYAARCYPDEFATYYGTQATCTIAVYEENCAGRACSDPYPVERLAWLESCRHDMAELSCGATQAPTWCLAAFQ